MQQSKGIPTRDHWLVLRTALVVCVFLIGTVLGVGCSAVEGEMRVDREKELGLTYILWDTTLGPLIQPEGLRYGGLYETSLGNNASRYIFVENSRLAGLILQAIALGIIIGAITLSYSFSSEKKRIWRRWKWSLLGAFFGIGIILGLELAFHNTLGVLLILASSIIAASFGILSIQEASREASR